MRGPSGRRRRARRRPGIWIGRASSRCWSNRCARRRRSSTSSWQPGCGIRYSSSKRRPMRRSARPRARRVPPRSPWRVPDDAPEYTPPELGEWGRRGRLRVVGGGGGGAAAGRPSFALVHEYHSPEGPLIHVDCYRLRRPEEALDLDLTALAARSRLLLIEWPERAGALAPAPDLHLRLEHVERPDRRSVEQVP